MGVTTPTQLPERRPRVKLHANARTTPAMRHLMVQRVTDDRWTVAAAAEAAGVSRRTAHKWLGRYRSGGGPALHDRSSAPHHQPRRTAPDRIAAIIVARHARLTAWAIARRVQLPRSTVAAVLARAGLGRLSCLTPRPTIHRYEWPAVGDLVHLDVKPLARILRVGHRIHGDR